MPFPREQLSVRLFRCALATGGFLALLASAAGAQDPPATPPAPVPPAVPDSLRPPVRPLPAFFRSIVLPGWGQAILDRKLTGGLFIAWEGITLSMMLKAHREVAYLRATESSRVPEGSTTESSRLRGKKAEREDWMVLLIFNHLFSGLEAYVGAHLWDFPADVQVRAVPGPEGRARPGVFLSVPFRVR